MECLTLKESSAGPADLQFLKYRKRCVSSAYSVTNHITESLGPGQPRADLGQPRVDDLGRPRAPTGPAQGRPKSIKHLKVHYLTFSLI